MKPILILDCDEVILEFARPFSDWLREVFDQDCRGRWVVITEAGRERRARMWTIYRRSIEEHLGARLSEAEAQMLTGLLKRLA